MRFVAEHFIRFSRVSKLSLILALLANIKPLASANRCISPLQRCQKNNGGKGEFARSLGESSSKEVRHSLALKFAICSFKFAVCNLQ